MPDRNYYWKNREKVLAKARTPEERAKRRAYYASTIERRRELDMLRHKRHRAKRIAAMRKYWYCNHDKMLAYKVAYFQRIYPLRKAELRVRNRLDRRKHREKRRATQRLWQRANRDKGRKYEATYMAKKPWVRTLKNGRRRVRLTNAKTDASAAKFIRKVRASTSVPCAYCGAKMTGKDAHIDHVVPLSRGGSHTAKNLRAACEFCNCSKCNKLLSEWVPPLRQPVLIIRKVGVDKSLKVA